MVEKAVRLVISPHYETTPPKQQPFPHAPAVRRDPSFTHRSQLFFGYHRFFLFTLA
jgi:hypothetical protein